MIREGFEYLFQEYEDYDECIDNNYYLCSCVYVRDSNILLMVLKISISMFFAYERSILLQYLYWASCIRHKPNLEVVQIKILEDGTYSCIVKTRYIKILQRKWREIYKNRKEFLKKINLKELIKRETNGRFSKTYY